MGNRTNILQELTALSPVIAGISNQNIFTVPIDYFDQLPSEIISSIKITALTRNNPYIIPADYFTVFSYSVLERIKNRQEYIKILPGNSNTYIVPSTYFDSFASSVLEKIKSKANKPVNEVSVELEAISPLLNSITRANIYSVPEGYFDDFAVNQYKEESQAAVAAKVISLAGKTKKWMYYAVAASVTAIMFFGGYSIFSNREIDSPPITSFPHEAALKGINIEQSIANLSDDDINNYLINQATVTEIAPVSFDGDSDLDNFIDNASDEEIQQYLNENSDPGEKKS